MNITFNQSNLFSSLRKTNPDIIDDGVICESEYLAAKYKIMFVLKEVNGGKGWSLRDFLKDGGRSQTWDNVARWTEAIFMLPKEETWKYWNENNENRRKTILKKICAVNLKKTSGGYVSDNNEIYHTALTNSEILCQQVILYNPDIIICCGTEKAFVNACYSNINLTWNTTTRGIRYFIHENTIVISFSHPEARVKDSFLHYALIDAVKEILTKKN